MISRNNMRTRGLIISTVRSPKDLPLPRMEIIKEPKSWIAPMNIEPKNTQIKAGIQPQIIAMAGPMIGPNPAIEVK